MPGRPFGQHFLTSLPILERISEAACPEREPVVLEIGPGKGALTAPLLRRADRVIAFEIDPALAGLLETAHAADALTVVRGDVLEQDLSLWGATVVAGNLPYYVASPIIEKVLGLGPPFRRAVFLVQREVAERIAAAPGSRDYGYLSVFCQLHAGAQVLFRVRPGAFSPPPKVDSAVIRLERNDGAARFGVHRDAFLRFAGRAFAHKRKTLRNNLLPYYDRRLLDSLPETAHRAEQLPLADLAALFLRLPAPGQGRDAIP